MSGEVAATVNGSGCWAGTECFLDAEGAAQQTGQATLWINTLPPSPWPAPGSDMLSLVVFVAFRVVLPDGCCLVRRAAPLRGTCRQLVPLRMDKAVLGAGKPAVDS
jgi:hypothetical protein